jgi:xanthine dehydrogenase iron-sulfur cluster and FAD-binding subunit A
MAELADSIVFAINGKRQVLHGSGMAPSTTLLDFLRSNTSYTVNLML